jgi:antitoxin component YwqK of YwqJK toxin-antitoxin module
MKAMRNIFLLLMLHNGIVLAQLPVTDKGEVGTEQLLSVEPVLITDRYFVILDNGEKQSVENSALLGTEGFETVWYLHDQKAWEGVRERGELEGLVTQWYENGQKKQENNYRDGFLHSDQFFWYENGQLARYEHYQKGQLHGRFS